MRKARSAELLLGIALVLVFLVAKPAPQFPTHVDSCGTGTVNMTAQYSFAANGALVQGDGVGTVLRTIAGQALCLKNTVASTTVVATVSFAQF